MLYYYLPTTLKGRGQSKSVFHIKLFSALATNNNVRHYNFFSNVITY